MNKKVFKLCSVLLTSLLVNTSCDLFSDSKSSPITSTSPVTSTDGGSSGGMSSSSRPSTGSNNQDIVIDYPSINPCGKRTGKSDKAKNLTIYSVNDTHGVIEDNASSYQAGLAKIREYVCSDVDYDPDYSIILSAGDMFQGSGMSNLTKGRAMISVMNAFPFDAMTIGNHEFDWGLDNMIETLSKNASFDVLANNIYYKNTKNNVDGLKPYTIVDRGGYKVGVIGSIEYGIDSSIMYNKLVDYDIVDDKDLTINQAKELKDAGCDYIVFLTHQGATTTVYNVLDNSEVDLAILGHTHALINEVSANGKPMLEARANAQSMSKVVVDSTGKLVSSGFKDFSKTDIEGIKLSTDMQDLLNAIHKGIDPILNEELTTVNGSLRRYDNGYSNTGSLGKFITKQIYDYGRKYGYNDIIAVYNTGGLRQDFVCSSSSCKLTYNHVYGMLPFENEIRAVKVSGSKLTENVLSKYIYYGVDFSTNKHVDGSDFSSSKTYNVITIDYLTTNPNYPLFYESGGGKIVGEKTIYTRDLIKEQLDGVSSININDYPF